MSFAHFTGVDWFALIVVAAFVVLGLVRGFVRELLRLCAWIGGLWLGQRCEGELTPILRRNVNGLQPPFDTFVAYALVLGAVLLACWILLRVFQSGLRRFHLQSYDRMFGAVLGAAKGVLVVTLAVLAVAQVPGFEAAKRMVRSSQTAPVADALVTHLRPLFPRALASEIDSFLNPIVPAQAGAK